MEPRWLDWVKALQSIAQNGLAYSTNEFDIGRFEQVRQIAAEIASAYTGVPDDRLEGLFAGEAGYATPKVDVRGAVFRDDAILLVRENLDAGRWTLPGGWADVGDSPAQAVEREIREESGFEAKAVKLAALYDRDKRGHPLFYFSIYKLFFLCELTGGAAATSIETSEVAFFHEHEIPELSIARVTPQEIAMLFEHRRHPELPTEFD
jgi:ADP-ribose pyrophosphatase YjhB (NUDIX family)